MEAVVDNGHIDQRLRPGIGVPGDGNVWNRKVRQIRIGNIEITYSSGISCCGGGYGSQLIAGIESVSQSIHINGDRRFALGKLNRFRKFQKRWAADTQIDCQSISAYGIAGDGQLCCTDGVFHNIRLIQAYAKSFTVIIENGKINLSFTGNRQHSTSAAVNINAGFDRGISVSIPQNIILEANIEIYRLFSGSQRHHWGKNQTGIVFIGKFHFDIIGGVISPCNSSDEGIRSGIFCHNTFVYGEWYSGNVIIFKQNGSRCALHSIGRGGQVKSLVNFRNLVILGGQTETRFCLSCVDNDIIRNVGKLCLVVREFDFQIMAEGMAESNFTESVPWFAFGDFIGSKFKG